MSYVMLQRITLAKSGVPRDNKVNTLFFEVGGTAPFLTTTKMTDLVNNVERAWTVATTFPALRSFLAESTMASQRTMYKVYDLEEAKPRTPYVTVLAANPTPANTGLPFPSEVALCLSFRGLTRSGQIAARRRGRIYLGPILQSACVQETASGEVRPHSDLQQAASQAFVRMGNECRTTPFFAAWSIYSPTTNKTASLDESFEPVQTVWCDNAFDTQRRRGVAASSRVQLTTP